MTWEQNSRFRIESSAKQQILIDDLSEKKPLKKGDLLRFQWNCTATSDGNAQKLVNDLWHDSESIATKVCSQIDCK